MRKGKRFRKTKRPAVLLVSLIMVLTVAVGGSLAYLVTQTEDVQNTFAVQRVPIEIIEDISGNKKESVTIKNVSNTDDGQDDPGTPAYIRAAVVVNWVNPDNPKEVYGEAPAKSNYSFSLNTKEPKGTGYWYNGNDGYYYYRGAVEAGEETSSLFNNNGCTMKNDGAPEGYVLSVEILAQSIQANGPDGTESAVSEAWGEEAARLVGETN